MIIWEERLKIVINSVKMGKVSVIIILLNFVIFVLFQVYCRVIFLYIVYLVNIERILVNMSYLSYDELEQNQLYKFEVRWRYERFK